jgi:hypothetical protein
MLFEQYPHRYADIILNSDYAIRSEIEAIVRGVSLASCLERYRVENARRVEIGRKEAKGYQTVLNLVFKEQFLQRVVIGTQKGPTSARNWDPPGFMSSSVVLGTEGPTPVLALDLGTCAGYRAAAG